MGDALAGVTYEAQKVRSAQCGREIPGGMRSESVTMYLARSHQLHVFSLTLKSTIVKVTNLPCAQGMSGQAGSLGAVG